MLNRWPEPGRPAGWAQTLSGVAQDEASHLFMVTRLLERRREKLERLHKCPYANELRMLVRAGQGPREILDRLLISALIEARSCERFEILSRRCRDASLASFYRRLHGAEARHYRVFLELARQAGRNGETPLRWKEMLKHEARIMQAQAPGPGILSGVSRLSAPPNKAKMMQLF